MKKYYISQIYLITTFYKHFYDIYKEKPIMMIDKMEESFSKLNQKNMPNFIKEWFSDIKCQVKLSQDKKDKIVNKNSINQYLNKISEVVPR